MHKYLLTLGLLGLMGSSLASEPITLRSGVILDNTQQTAIVMLPGGGIGALDLNTGGYKWTSAASDKPIAFVNGRLLSMKQNSSTGLLSMVYHNSNDGKAENSMSVELPQQVMASVVDGASHQFIIETKTGNQNQLQWRFSGGKAQGIAPVSLAMLEQNNQAAATQNTTLSGVIVIDAADSTLSNSPGNEGFDVTSAVIEQPLLPNKQGRQFLSQNGSHILVSERITSKKAITYQWTIYTQNGDLLNTMMSPLSYAPFVVVGDQILFIEPAKGEIIDGELVKNPPLLKSYGIQSKKKSWEQPVRAIKYFGQLPV